MKTFVDVLLPLYLRQAYTYSVSDSLSSQVEVGKRVIVSFGRNKFYTGIIQKIHHQTPDYPNVKDVEEVLDTEPIVHSHQLKLWQWIADYYLCAIGEVVDAALPGVLKLSSERIYKAYEDVDISHYGLDQETFMLADAAINQGQLTLQDIKHILNDRNGIKEINELVQLGILYPMEELHEKYKPKYERMISIAPEYLSDSVKRSQLFDQKNTRNQNQYQLLLTYFGMNPKGGLVSKSELIIRAQSKASYLKPLIDKSIFIESKVAVDRLDISQIASIKQVQLSEVQESTYRQIVQSFESFQTVLFRGITGSGKTEIYIRWIQDLLLQNKKILYLLPEIALTNQIVERLRAYFGDKMAVFHSKIGQNEKFELWQKVYKNEVNLVIGARSSIFLPFKQLDAIIIDEEHDSSLKQMEPNPKFHARDTALFYANIFNAKTLLGSATPSLDSVFNVQHGKYGMVELEERYGNASLPEVQLIDLNHRVKNKLMKSDYSLDLIQAIQDSLHQNEQILLFQNRRGYAPYIQCADCQHIPNCVQCDVRLTYHSFNNCLVCHYCNKKYAMSNKCQNCGHSSIKIKGLGTQKVEEEINLFFDDVKILRVDMDTTRGKERLQEQFNQFNKGAIDIMIGTQMVTKGLDFDNLQLVGVLNADSLFAFTDYKTNERAFQTLYQVCGRAGRKEKKGRVLIQTSSPEEKVLQFVVHQDWKNFVAHEMPLREKFLYPPFCKILKLDIWHRDEKLLEKYVQLLIPKIKEKIQSVVLGPNKPYVSKIRNQFVREIIIKLPRTKEMQQQKNTLQQLIELEMIHIANKSFRVDITVDF
jgi:primosomal protein N' (replication factor Y)